jgi:hypothetical protein
VEARDAKQFVSDSVARLIRIYSEQQTGEQSQLTNFDLTSGSVIQNLDISPDGMRAE